MENRIPKVIHYAWFGKGKMSATALKCISSWKRLLSDYEIIEWNEDNFQMDMYTYAKEAYDAKKYAYVADVVRLHVLYEYGGVYMDSDVEVIKTINPFLELHGFSGFQSEKEIPTGIIAAEKGNQWIKDQLDYYNENHFNIDDVNIRKITNVDIITNISLKKHGLVLNNKEQELKYGMRMYPLDYFCAKSAETGVVYKTNNTYTIHHFNGSWAPLSAKRNKMILRLIEKLMGHDRTMKIYNRIQKK